MAAVHELCIELLFMDDQGVYESFCVCSKEKWILREGNPLAK